MFFRRDCIGVELEFTGVKREDVVNVLETFFQTKAEGFDASVNDNKYTAYRLHTKSGKWLVLRDRSIKTEVYRNKLLNEDSESFETVPIDDTEYACELVSPVLNSENFVILLQVMSIIKGIGGIANSSCGVHIHVDGWRVTGETECCQEEVDLIQLFEKYCEQEESLYKLLNVTDYRREKYCKVFNYEKGDLAKLGITDNASFKKWLYSKYSESGEFGDRTLRYYGLNFHALKEHKTIEFRVFNGTLDVREFVGYLKFALQIGYSEEVCEKYFSEVSKYFLEKGIDIS